jgi:hypothetical protein
MRVRGWWSTVGAVLVALIPTVVFPGPAAASDGTTSDAAAELKPTTSHYMVLAADQGGSHRIGYRTGCADARQGTSGLRVLFFGAQEAQGRIRPPGTTVGSKTVRFGGESVVAATSGWVRGFTACGSGRAVLALGVSNRNDGGVAGAEAGAAWARVVERAVTASPAERVTVAGAFDGEPGYSDPGWARGWVDAYVGVSSRALYAAASADGCPDGGTGDRCDNGWSVADVFHMSTGAGRGVYALPQIYRVDGIQARQWATISRWGVRTGRGPLRMAGALSQEVACRQKRACTPGGRPATNNSPTAAREQLTSALAGDPGTRSAVPLLATDVAWPDDEAEG